MLSEKDKYEKVWEECARYGKDWTDRGLGRPYKRPFEERVPKGSTVIDFGCGNGSSLSWLSSAGYRPHGVEIAANAIKSNHGIITVADLRKPPMWPRPVQYGICTDVMEHIPTKDVYLTIMNIGDSVEQGALFGIARLPDKDGDELGLELHLTIRDKEWWDEILLKFFERVEVVRYDDGCYIVWGWHY
jgi:hypothetical protein